MQSNRSQIRTVNVTRYVTPLREGGSLPAISEADDDFMYVVKFRGAGQGVKALIAELIAGEIARALGLKIPEIVLANLDPAFGRSEPDEEIQDLLKASTGLNLALHFLSGAIMFDPVITAINEQLASEIVWFDCFVTNVDRTVRNTNLLMWHKQLWLIDHGASLYFHHNWPRAATVVARPYDAADHVLRSFATDLAGADAALAPLVKPVLPEVLALVPDSWLLDSGFDSAAAARAGYLDHLGARADLSAVWLPRLEAA